MQMSDLLIYSHTMIEDVGFTDIHWQVIQRPTNDWPKDPKMKEIGMVRRPPRSDLWGFTD